MGWGGCLVWQGCHYFCHFTLSSTFWFCFLVTSSLRDSNSNTVTSTYSVVLVRHKASVDHQCAARCVRCCVGWVFLDDLFTGCDSVCAPPPKSRAQESAGSSGLWPKPLHSTLRYIRQREKHMSAWRPASTFQNGPSWFS